VPGIYKTVIPKSNIHVDSNRLNNFFSSLTFIIRLHLNIITMSESTVSKKIKNLPPETKQQAQDFVDFLYERYVKDETKKSEKKSILESSFFVLWKDREDMQDSTACET